MRSNEDLTPSNIRKLANLLQSPTQPRLKHYLEESGAIKYHGKGGYAKRDQLLHTLENGNGTDEVRQFISTIINEEFDHSDASEIRDAIEGSKFTVQTSDSGLKILMDHSSVASEEIQSHESYLETHAPERTLNKYHQAKELLAKGDRSTSLYKCRMALDTLTIVTVRIICPPTVY